ncbi:Dabb family protein [Aquimarina sp. 2201CG14-23]|uniref:Dabb family protein n=1 Tax=Aquimarina mycalae TaxID=3040073 RepID=UPI002477FEE5|nr:Dabb family protein [Aquimarina sp. 2201CG14-23]MDH7445566.1 Dabb family protein [Aquimarina sp. 2201CG14-23]
MNFKNTFKRKLSLLVATVIICVSVSCQKNTNQFDKNFVHTVYIWLKNPNSQEDRELFEKSLDKFLKTSKYAKTNFVGTPAGTDRAVVDNSYTYAIIVTFSSKEEQDLYQKEEAHLLFIKESSPLWNKVQIYDSIDIK